MAQSNYNIPNTSAPAARAQLNSVFQSIATNNSGTAPPSTTFPYQWWYDTTTNILKQRNAADTAFIDIGTFDQGAGTFSPAGVGQLTQSQAEDPASTVFGQVSGQRLAQASAGAITDLAEGAAGAPRIALSSLSRLVNGAEIKIREDSAILAGGNAPTDTFTQVREIGFVQTGSASIHYQYRRQGTLTTRTARLVRLRASNSTILQTDTTSSTSYQTRTVSVDVLAGDLYFLEGDGFFNANYQTGSKTEFRNVRVLCSSDTVLFPVSNFGP